MGGASWFRKCAGDCGINRERISFRARGLDPRRLENDSLCFIDLGGFSAVFFDPSVKNLNGLEAGHQVLLVQQLEALRAVPKVHPHFSLRKQLNDNIETKSVRLADSHHVFADFAR